VRSVAALLLPWIIIETHTSELFCSKTLPASTLPNILGEREKEVIYEVPKKERKKGIYGTGTKAIPTPL
jgi:hypothetical protein